MVGGIFAGAIGGAGVSIVISAVDRFSNTFKKARRETGRLKGETTGLSSAMGMVKKLYPSLWRNLVSFLSFLSLKTFLYHPQLIQQHQRSVVFLNR